MNFNTKKLGMMEPYSLGIRNTINYPLGKSMSTGIISYVYLKNIITANDSIFLVGFNHNISKKHHNHNFEKDFFSSEINNKKCKVLY
jgi:hypothetical protein